jgi:hypothetical protein
VVKQLFYFASKYSKSLEPYVRKLADSVTITVTPLSPAHKQINVQEGHHRLALDDVPGDDGQPDGAAQDVRLRWAVWRHTEGRSLLRSISRCS